MKAFFPVFTWLVWVVLLGPEFRQNQWECLLVMFAAVELVPRGLRLLGRPQKETYAALAVGFCAAYFFNGYWFLALPYFAWAIWLTLQEVLDMANRMRLQLIDFVRLFAMGYWATGAAFALSWLIGIYPLDFDPVIVSLTAAHFHIAGFSLSVLIFKMLQSNASRYGAVLGRFTLAGMPLVALGITTTKLGGPAILEQGAALVFVVFGLFYLIQQFRLSFDARYPVVARRLWLAGALCLLVGVTLAGVYALRFQFPIAWFNIPNLKIWHGTLNTLGFAWLGMLAWYYSSNERVQS